MKSWLHWCRVAVAGLLFWSNLSVSVLSPSRLWAQGASGSDLAATAAVREAQAFYEESKFDEAISRLKDVVERGMLSGPDLEKAREILARSYVKKGDPRAAQDQFKAILRLNPSYRPDPVRIPPDETAVFEQALKALSEEQSSPPTPLPPQPTPTPTPAPKHKKSLWSQWWVWAIGAGVVGGAALAAGGGGGGGGGTTDQPLPSFPVPPAR